MITIQADGTIRIDGVLAGYPADAAANWPALAADIEIIARDWVAAQPPESPHVEEASPLPDEGEGAISGDAPPAD